MSEINWNEAPEGATHWATLDDLINRWHMLKGGSLYFFSSRRRWIKYEKDTSYVMAIRESLIPRSEEEKWNGEGLPPAGTVCEVLNTSMMHSEYEECMIHWIGDYSVVYTSEDSFSEKVAKIVDLVFRPIKTEEEKAVDEIVDR